MGIVERRILAILACLIVSALACFAQQVSVATTSKLSGLPKADKLLGPVLRRVVFDSSPFSPGSIVPHWENGFVISRDVQISGPGRSAVRLFDSTGAKVRDISVWFPQAAQVNIGSASVTSSGRVVISGSTQSSKDSTWATFIAWVDQSGRITNIVQTLPFRVQHSCAAPDGTAWAFGETGESGQPGDPMLRNFDPDKGQIAALLPRSSFTTQGHRSPAFRGGEGMRVYLRCSAEKLIIYSDVANEFLEMDYATETVRRWQIDRSHVNISPEGFAVTQSGSIFTASKNFSDRVGHWALFQLETDPALGKARWLHVPVDGVGTVDQCPIRTLLGADGDSLVYLQADEIPIVLWAAPVIRTAEK